MLTSVLEQVNSLVPSRFKLNALLPALIAMFALGGLALVATDGVDAGIERWEGQPGIVQGAAVAIAVAVAFTLASFLDSQTLRLIKFYEGYPRAEKRGWFREAGAQWHLDRAEELGSTGAGVNKFLTDYPSTRLDTSDDLLPTRLGNVMRSGESYPLERYGVNSIVVWPRLYPLLPEGTVTAIGESRSSMEQLLVFATMSATLGTAAGVVYALEPWGLVPSLASLLGGWLLAGLCYRGAVDHAVSYSQQLKAAFDNHRLLLLDQLRVPPPRNIAEERRRWAVVVSQLASNGRVRWAYAEEAAE